MKDTDEIETYTFPEGTVGFMIGQKLIAALDRAEKAEEALYRGVVIQRDEALAKIAAIRKLCEE